MSFPTIVKRLSKTERPWALADLPPYRPVAKRLMTLTSFGDVPLSSVQEVLRTDAAFTADVLRLANSPLIGMHTPVTSVLQAVMRLGLERIKSLATTLALRSFLTSGVPSEALQACWRHNLATAIICEKLARVFHIDTDTCYTVGLLHDIGRLALLRACPREYEGIFQGAEAPGFDLLRAEAALFDIDHCQAGGWILDHWEFPQELRDAVSEHHNPPGPGASDLRRSVFAGWQIADCIGFSGLFPVHGDLHQVISALPGKTGQEIVAQLDTLAEEVTVKVNAVESSLV